MKKTAIIILTIILVSVVIICNWPADNKVENLTLNYVEKIQLKVPEPSGLYFDKKRECFWTVSDEDSSVYKLNFNGEIINSFKVNGFDLEGITKLNDSTLVTILERTRTVLFINEDGREVSRFNLNYAGKPNQGLEGISYNQNNNTFFVLKEKNPGLLIVVGTDGKVLSEKELKLASDYSGLWYDDTKDELWIISDEANSIFRCKSNGELIKKYKVDIKQIEGIAIDFENSNLYIISDPLETLFKFNLQ